MSHFIAGHTQETKKSSFLSALRNDRGGIKSSLMTPASSCASLLQVASNSRGRRSSCVALLPTVATLQSNESPSKKTGRRGSCVDLSRSDSSPKKPRKISALFSKTWHFSSHTNAADKVSSTIVSHNNDSAVKSLPIVPCLPFSSASGILSHGSERSNRSTPSSPTYLQDEDLPSQSKKLFGRHFDFTRHKLDITNHPETSDVSKNHIYPHTANSYFETDVDVDVFVPKQGDSFAKRIENSLKGRKSSHSHHGGDSKSHHGGDSNHRIIPSITRNSSLECRQRVHSDDSVHWKCKLVKKTKSSGTPRARRASCVPGMGWGVVPEARLRSPGGSTTILHRRGKTGCSKNGCCFKSSINQLINITTK